MKEIPRKPLEQSGTNFVLWVSVPHLQPPQAVSDPTWLVFPQWLLAQCVRVHIWILSTGAAAAVTDIAATMRVVFACLFLNSFSSTRLIETV